MYRNGSATESVTVHVLKTRVAEGKAIFLLYSGLSTEILNHGPLIAIGCPISHFCLHMKALVHSLERSTSKQTPLLSLKPSLEYKGGLIRATNGLG